MTMRKIQGIDAWAAITSAVVISGFVFVCLLVWSLTAHGQASRPASQPARVLKVAKAAKAAPVKVMPAKATVKVVASTKALAHAALLTPAKVVAAPASAPASAPVAPVAPVVVVAPAAPVAPVVVAPASQPAPSATWRAWLRDNWRYLVFVIVLPSLITALKKKGVRDGLAGFLEAVLERTSVTQPHNSFGTLKWPGQAAGPPVEPPKPPEPLEPPAEPPKA
jgi:hypothetical protein